MGNNPSAPASSEHSTEHSTAQDSNKNDETIELVEVKEEREKVIKAYGHRSDTISSDVTIYGATSFVARYVCEYLISAIDYMEPSKLYTSDRQSLRITLAGRNETKINARREEMKEQFQSILNKKTDDDSYVQLELDMFVADSSDLAALTNMARRTGVVINCAGPFAAYGTNVVEACATGGADYVDITGEVEWAGEMRRQFGDLAGKSGSRIISFCGFDSIPSDLAIFASVQKWQQTVSPNISSKTHTLNVSSGTCWHSAKGLMNGGTLHTAIDMPIEFKKCMYDENGKMRPVPFLINDPFTLTHSSIYGSSSAMAQKWKYLAAKTEWINNFLTIDSVMKYAASIPFFMAPINAKIVYSSATALKYSPVLDNKPFASNVPKPFTYKERMLPLGIAQSQKLGPLSIIPGLLFHLTIGFFVTIFKTPFLGKLLATWVLPPGSGSPDYINRSGTAEVYALITGEVFSNDSCSSSDEYPNRASCHIKFQGDPGNLVTAQCVVESALSLILNRPDLPKRSEDGFGTPAQLLGGVLLQRLKESKVRTVTVQTNVWKDGERPLKEKTQ